MNYIVFLKSAREVDQLRALIDTHLVALLFDSNRKPKFGKEYYATLGAMVARNVAAGEIKSDKVGVLERVKAIFDKVGSWIASGRGASAFSGIASIFVDDYRLARPTRYLSGKDLVTTGEAASVSLGALICSLLGVNLVYRIEESWSNGQLLSCQMAAQPDLFGYASVYRELRTSYHPFEPFGKVIGSSFDDARLRRTAALVAKSMIKPAVQAAMLAYPWSVAIEKLYSRSLGVERAVPSVTVLKRGLPSEPPAADLLFVEKGSSLNSFELIRARDAWQSAAWEARDSKTIADAGLKSEKARILWKFLNLSGPGALELLAQEGSSDRRTARLLAYTSSAIMLQIDPLHLNPVAFIAEESPTLALSDVLDDTYVNEARPCFAAPATDEIPYTRLQLMELAPPEGCLGKFAIVGTTSAFEKRSQCAKFKAMMDGVKVSVGGSTYSIKLVISHASLESQSTGDADLDCFLFDCYGSSGLELDVNPEELKSEELTIYLLTVERS